MAEKTVSIFPFNAKSFESDFSYSLYLHREIKLDSTYLVIGHGAPFHCKLNLNLLL